MWSSLHTQDYTRLCWTLVAIHACLLGVSNTEAPEVQCFTPLVKNNPDLSWKPRKIYYNVGESIRWECDLGYIMNGNSLSTCTVHGNFTKGPICIPKTCKPPETNAIFKPLKDIYEFKDIIKFKCQPDHILQGKDYSACGIRGEFLDLPYCKRICPTPLITDHPNLHWEPKKENYDVGESIQWECEAGYVMNGANTSNCTEGSNFTTRPLCIPKTCKLPNLIKITPHPLKQIYNFKDVVDWRCPPKYSLYGGNSRSICDMNGEFTDVPSCRITHCIQPKLTSVTLLDNSLRFEFGQFLPYRCRNSDYELDGPSFSICLKTGEFTRISECRKSNLWTFKKKMDILMNQNQGFERNTDKWIYTTTFVVAIILIILIVYLLLSIIRICKRRKHKLKKSKKEEASEKLNPENCV